MKPHVRTALAAAFLIAFSLGAAAQDAPGQAGRISLVEGRVKLGGLAEPGPAMLNFPVTSGMELTTEREARTEVRVGSTAVRLDGDSSLEVTQLDDDHFRLRLYYGSVSVRVRDRELAADFALETPQGQIRLAEPGQIRVDAEREPDTTALSVFDGTAVLDGYGNSLTVHAGRRAELRGDDVRTSYAARDAFDDWSELRDRRDERVVAIRYVPATMTGYEDLDSYGYWRDSAEYGVLWIPRVVPSGWAPYRDGRWVWLDPWGWTWVDRAPWGYAPFHYGRWVLLNGRWCWAPGRYQRTRPAWAPALVGWVGGANWQLTFTHDHDRRPLPAQGWYPLSPRDHWVPPYRARPEHVRVITGQELGPDRHHRDFRPQGVTVVPQHEFTRGGVIDVPRAPKAGLPPGGLSAAVTAAAQPAPPPPAAREPHRRQPGAATVIPYRPGVTPEREHEDHGRRPPPSASQPAPAPLAPQPGQPANVRPPYAPPQAAQPVPVRPPFAPPAARPPYAPQPAQPTSARPPFAPPQQPAPSAPAPQAGPAATSQPPLAQPPGHERDGRPVPAPQAERPHPSGPSAASKRRELQDDGADEARPERRAPPRPVAAPVAVPPPAPSRPTPQPQAAPPQANAPAAQPPAAPPAQRAPHPGPARKKDDLRDDR